MGLISGMWVHALGEASGLFQELLRRGMLIAHEANHTQPTNDVPLSTAITHALVEGVCLMEGCLSSFVAAKLQLELGDFLGKDELLPPMASLSCVRHAHLQELSRIVVTPLL